MVNMDEEDVLRVATYGEHKDDLLEMMSSIHKQLTALEMDCASLETQHCNKDITLRLLGEATNNLELAKSYLNLCGYSKII